MSQVPYRLHYAAGPIRFRSNGPDTVNYMELSKGRIIQKPKMQKLSSLFLTHRLSLMHAPVKFHEYIPYGLELCRGHG